MAYRRRRQRSFSGHDRPALDNVDHLSFKYMEMCKMGSSTDSDSEISPRWSDTSTMGYVSSAPESGTSRRALTLTQKPSGRHGGYSLFLDPYDGSSEDSEESSVEVFSRQTRQQGKGVGGGGCRLSGRAQRVVFRPPASVQMKCESDSDALPSLVTDANLPEESAADPAVHGQAMDIELQLDASGTRSVTSCAPHTPRSQTPGSGSSSHRYTDRCSSSLHKRKLGLLGAEALQLEQRKRPCVCAMENE
ncbi:uncharacterized protein LOC115407135 [Salarias fasciatus]|uniref:uncharacterized protein LOC115407135 n=1 Tax=Salarias fasciatus TaxID=181472 RepID=UPI0011769F39|nr:uncharacterized protein LOC115407135 [Salarias fasciatus]